MAKSRTVPDEFSSIVYVSHQQAVANTLEFTQIQTGYGSLQKTAWIINRIEWYIPGAELAKIVANADEIQLALTTSNLVSSLSLADSALMDLFQIQISAQTAVGFEYYEMPKIRDFSGLPGGGKMVLPYPLFMAVNSASLATAISASARIYFTEREMDQDEWLELVQQTRLLS